MSGTIGTVSRACRLLSSRNLQKKPFLLGQSQTWSKLHSSSFWRSEVPKDSVAKEFEESEATEASETVLEGLGQEKLKNKKTRSIGVRKTQEFANSTQVVDSEKALQALSSAELGGEFQVYPDEETAETLFNGIKYKDLPYVHVEMSANNTRMSAYSSDNEQLHYTTAVEQGFLNAKKKSAVAAQAVGLAMGQKLRTMNQRTVRVRLKGFNLGRIPAVQGLVQAGINIVSVSDVTHIDWTWQKRAKKRRRL